MVEIWRMAFKNGSRGFNLWHQCKTHGLAVIAHPEMDFDLSKYPPEKFPDKWASLASAPKYSLRAFAFRVRAGDVIYAKDGAHIVGRGVVKRRYHYYRSCPVRDENGERWPHVLDVGWEADFLPVEIFLGDAQRFTIRRLTRADLSKFRGARVAAAAKTAKEEQRRAAIEGQIERRQVLWRKRNRGLIEAKKVRSNYQCEVCGLRYDGMYGPLGSDYIVAHHIDLLAGKRVRRRTTMDDIALLCANCHAMIHRTDPLVRPAELRKKVLWRWDARSQGWRTRASVG